MCCTFSSAYLFPAKNGKNRKKIFFSFSARTHACFLLFLHTFSSRKMGKVEKKSFFLSLPERTRVFFVSAYLFRAKNGKNRKIFFFSFSARTHACFFCFCIPFPRKKREKSKNFLFSFSARTHKRVRARKTTRAIQLSENRRGRFGIARTVTSSCGHCLKSAPKSARIVILLA